MDANQTVGVAVTQPGGHPSTYIAVFPGEISRPPREWAERSYNVCRWTEMARGGHFAALEEPELLAEDVRAFFRAYRTTGTLGQPIA